MNKERLLKLADFLDTLEESKFDFSKVVSKHDNECGTVCCAMGWTPHVFPEEVEWDPFRRYSGVSWGVTTNTDPDGYENYISVAMKLFDISEEHAEGLFTPRGQHYLRKEFTSEQDGLNPFEKQIFPDLNGESKPQYVAQLIRNYVEVVEGCESGK